jgi:hypothetical protein
VADCGLDLKRLDGLEAEEDRLLADFLRQVRPPLADWQHDLEAHLRARTTQAARYPHMGQQATLLGADISTNMRDGSGATFVWLYDAEEIRSLSDVLQGSGWGRLVKENPAYPNTTAQWWYLWTPPEDGTYWFWVIATYSGFRAVRANDKWYNRKYAKAHFYYDVDVHQYFWHGPDYQTVMDKRGSNITDAGEVSGSIHWLFGHRLKGGDEVTVKVTATLDVYS